MASRARSRSAMKAPAEIFPFGVIVDNIGLNGLLLLDNQDEREFFITADGNTPEQTRQFHLTTAAGGGQSSWPVTLHVRRPVLRSANATK